MYATGVSQFQFCIEIDQKYIMVSILEIKERIDDPLSPRQGGVQSRLL